MPTILMFTDNKVVRVVLVYYDVSHIKLVKKRSSCFIWVGVILTYLKHGDKQAIIKLAPANCVVSH